MFDIPFTPYTPDKKIQNLSTLKTTIETDRVLAYHLLQMDGITVGKSPFGMTLMMERAGLAPKMDIVDITNCIMTELGQPMHAFDREKITGNIHVRQANPGEKILALNGTEYTLTTEDVVIADDRGPVAIAGVIGGMESAVSTTTTSLIWESACFDATSVRLTAQRHGIRTDASTRYEKSLDPILAGMTFTRVMEYLDFLEKSYSVTATSSFLDEKQVNTPIIEVETRFLHMKAGVEIPEASIQAILIRLGFSYIQTGEHYMITVPSWRASKDISIQEDIAEEIVRIYGYENVPYTPLESDFSIARKNEEILLRNLTLNHFSEHGWHEVYNYSFSSAPLDQKIGLPDMENAIGIQNAFNEEYTHMVRSLAPRLFLDMTHNQKYSEGFSLFEIGKVYHRIGDRREQEARLLEKIEKKPLPEKKVLAGVTLAMSFEQLRKDLESYLRKSIGYVSPVHQGGTGLTFLHPGISGSYSLDEAVLIRFGKIHPETAYAFDISTEILYFECDYEAILRLRTDIDERFHEISRFQTIHRELNFLLPQGTPTGDIARIIDAMHPWITELRVDSIFEDEEKIGK